MKYFLELDGNGTPVKTYQGEDIANAQPVDSLAAANAAFEPTNGFPDLNVRCSLVRIHILAGGGKFPP